MASISSLGYTAPVGLDGETKSSTLVAGVRAASSWSTVTRKPLDASVATTTGTPERRSTSATASSVSVTPTVASTTNSTASAVAAAIRAWPAIRAASDPVFSSDGCQPPVSTRVKSRPLHSAS